VKLSCPAEAVVVPAFNEAATIRDVVAGVLRHVSVVIVVDDGSTDGTADAVAGLPVTVLRNARNLGKAACIWLGAQEAIQRGATAIITIDGDGQHDPVDLPLLLDAHRAAKGSIVIGSRLHARTAIPVARYRANRFANFWISWAAGYPIVDTQSGYRVYPAAVLAQVAVPHDRAASFVFESEILIAAARAGVTAICVPVTVTYTDIARASHFRPVIDIARIALMVAARLLARGLHPAGLVRSLRRPTTAAERRRLRDRYAGQ
jgi:glycosyltransferase involved in cell wall biosynthesis